jgi:hypothetical protein
MNLKYQAYNSGVTACVTAYTDVRFRLQNCWYAGCNLSKNRFVRIVSVHIQHGCQGEAWLGGLRKNSAQREALPVRIYTEAQALDLCVIFFLLPRVY